MNDKVSEIRLQIRYGDMDILAHVNNAAYLSYFELGRMDFMSRFYPGFDPLKINFVLAHAEVDFKKPIHLLDQVSLRTFISDTGSTSFTFSHQIINDQDGTVYCKGKTVAVMLSENGEKTSIPDKLRDLVHRE